MTIIAKKINVTEKDDNLTIFTEVKQLYIFGNALVVTGKPAESNEQELEKFYLRDLKSLMVEF